MKEEYISLTSVDCISELSDKIVLNKKTLISVPNGYECYVYFDEKLLMRVEPCVNQPLYKITGKEIIGKTVYAAYVATKNDFQFLWGFGNVNVNNARLKEAYRVGANGKLTVKAVNGAQFIRSFDKFKRVTAEDVKTKLLSVIKTVGVPILADFFVESDVSVFEISSKIDDFREKLLVALRAEKSVAETGLEISDLTVDGLHVNDEDLALIRDRING